jgi:SAM-dependent methyltransferase
MLLERVGPSGSVVALDESPAWMRHLEARAAEAGRERVELVRARIQDVELARESFDLVFARWVIGFLPEPAAVIARLASFLRPGGVLAVQDYNHEGISVFPESAGFRAVVRGTRDTYARKGGDTWIAARLPGHLRRAGLELTVYEPRVLCGGPGSPAFRWADAFFTHHCHGMAEAGVVTADERDLFLREWAERKAHPDAVFFSPIVVGAAARKPG